MVMMSITPGVGFIMTGRGVFFTGMIRVDILWILRVILMLMTVFHMSVFDDYGRTNVSERSKKSGKQQQPTCEDGL